MHLECQTCGASLLVDPNQRTALCPYCASPSVVERPPSVDRPPPHFVLGFTMTKEGAQGSVKEWLGRRSFFVQSSVKGGTVDSIKGVYTPAYLYSAMATSQYSAQIGENYQETETYTDTDSNGNTVVKTRTVTRTEYRYLSGQHSCYVSDVIVTGSRAVPNNELEAIEPFDLRMMRRYTPAVISGWIAEEPSMALPECYQLARGETMEKIAKELEGFMPGDSHQGLTFNTVLDRETTELIYVPIWVLAIRHDPQKPPFRVLINGQTGRIYGKAPLSWLKILLVILLVIALIAIPFVLNSLFDKKPDTKPPPSTPTATATQTTAAPPPTMTATAPTTTATTKTTAPVKPTAPKPTGTTPKPGTSSTKTGGTKR
jgi:hypothetical protein